MNKKPAVLARYLLLVLASMTLLGLIATLPLEGRGERDLLVYWSAAAQLAQGDNPYDLSGLESRQRQARPDWEREDGIGLGSWNPPWLLFLLLPLGWLPFDIAARLWLLLQFALFALAAYIAWDLVARPGEGRGFPLALAVVFAFGATLVAIKIGQVAVLVLLGVVLFPWLLRRRRNYLAGAALVLAAIKPHITFLYLLLVGVWWLRRRRWSVAAGAAAVVCLAAIALWLLYPGWLTAYAQLMSEHVFGYYLNATVGSFAYNVWGVPWLRYAGLLTLPLIWLLLPMIEKRGWFTALNLSLVVSLPFAPYGFFFDQIVLLPAIIQTIYWLWRGALPRLLSILVAGGLIMVYLILLWMTTLVLYEYWFAWAPLAIGILYIYAASRLPAQPNYHG